MKTFPGEISQPTHIDADAVVHPLLLEGTSRGDNSVPLAQPYFLTKLIFLYSFIAPISGSQMAHPYKQYHHKSEPEPEPEPDIAKESIFKIGYFINTRLNLSCQISHLCCEMTLN